MSDVCSKCGFSVSADNAEVKETKILEHNCICEEKLDGNA